MHQRGTFPICSAPSKVRKITELPETFEDDGSILYFSDNFGYFVEGGSETILSIILRQEAKQVLIEDLPINTAIQNSNLNLRTAANRRLFVILSPIQINIYDEVADKRSGYELNRLLVPGEVFLIGVKTQTEFQSINQRAFELNSRPDNVPGTVPQIRPFDIFDAEGNVVSGALNVEVPRSVSGNTWFTIMWSGRRFVLLGSNNWVNKT